NHLKQQALAVHNFHDALGRLPTYLPPGKDLAHTQSVHWQILPYLEQGNFAASADSNKGATGRIALLLDPLDPTSANIPADLSSYVTSYAFNGSVVGVPAVAPWHDWIDQRTKPYVLGPSNRPAL